MISKLNLVLHKHQNKRTHKIIYSDEYEETVWYYLELNAYVE